MATLAVHGVISRQQWDDMKSFIRRIYIDENKTFYQVANDIRNNFGWEPTKRQFSRKIEEWGFRKNVSRIERRRIMKTFNGESTYQTIDREDRRVTIEKLKNWKRRYKEDASIMPFLAPSGPPASQTCVFQSDPGTGFTASQSPMDVQAQWQAPHSNGIIETVPFKGAIGVSHHSMELQKGSATNISPFDWGTADIPGSPGLSRLLEGLEIECSEPISAISLDRDSLEEYGYVSQQELSRLSSSGLEHPQELKLEMVPNSLSQHSNQQAKSHQAAIKSQQTIELAFRDRQLSPFHEIYVFPTCSTKSTLYAPNRNVEKLKAQAAEYEWRLDRLTPLCGTGHLGIRTMMAALAKSYHNIARLHATILTVHGHQSILNTRATFIKARIAGITGDFTEAEVLTREVLQRRLSGSGPRNPDTWRTIEYLASILVRQAHFSEAERLSRIALQLCGDVSGLDEQEVLNPKKYLSLICSYQGRFDESRNLSRLLMNDMEASLGNEHPCVLEAQYAMAVSLRREGRFLESERLFQEVYKKRVEVLGESHPETWNTASSFAYLLYRMEKFNDAIIWYERSFWQRVEIYGPGGNKTMNACCWLGDCYQKLGRYNDALSLYRQIAGKLRTANQEDTLALAQIRDLINWTMLKGLEVDSDEVQECVTIQTRRRKTSAFQYGTSIPQSTNFESSLSSMIETV
ncbi:TPR-like protein [Cadophora sp. DSE1049]|nr:TPR-like protein [Cadophora sp. DSE1049]